MRKRSSLRDGLVGAWCPSLTNGAGYLLPDLSGNGFHGTLTDTMAADDYVALQNYRGLRINSSGDGIDTRLTTSVRNCKSTFSFACWFRLFTAGEDDRGSLFNLAQFNSGFSCACNNNSLLFLFTANGVALNFAHSSTSLGMICGTYDGLVGRKVYSNGLLVASDATASGNVPTGGEFLEIGKRSSLRYMDGVVFDFRIYSRVLTDPEIKQLYEGGPGYGLRPERRRSYYVALGSPSISLPKFLRSSNRMMFPGG